MKHLLLFWMAIMGIMVIGGLVSNNWSLVQSGAIGLGGLSIGRVSKE